MSIWPQFALGFWPFELELYGKYSVRLVTRRSTRRPDVVLPRSPKYTSRFADLSHCSPLSRFEVSVNVHRPVFLSYSLVSSGLQLRPQRPPRLFVVSSASLKSNGSKPGPRSA